MPQHEHDFKKFPELTNNQMQFYYWDSPHKQIVEDFSARVTRVVDGDTIIVKWSERNFEFPIRFFDNAAPELKEKGGLESKRWLENRVLNKHVDIQVDQFNRVEKWGRLLGRIIAGGSDVGEDSIRDGQSKPWAERLEGTLNG